MPTAAEQQAIRDEAAATAREKARQEAAARNAPSNPNYVRDGVAYDAWAASVAQQKEDLVGKFTRAVDAMESAIAELHAVAESLIKARTALIAENKSEVESAKAERDRLQAAEHDRAAATHRKAATRN